MMWGGGVKRDGDCFRLMTVVVYGHLVVISTVEMYPSAVLPYSFLSLTRWLSTGAGFHSGVFFPAISRSNECCSFGLLM